MSSGLTNLIYNTNTIKDIKKGLIHLKLLKNKLEYKQNDVEKSEFCIPPSYKSNPGCFLVCSSKSTDNIYSNTLVLFQCRNFDDSTHGTRKTDTATWGKDNLTTQRVP